jgi:hypothetical protein
MQGLSCAGALALEALGLLGAGLPARAVLLTYIDQASLLAATGASDATPGALALLGIGCAGLAFGGRRRASPANARVRTLRRTLAAALDLNHVDHDSGYGRLRGSSDWQRGRRECSRALRRSRRQVVGSHWQFGPLTFASTRNFAPAGTAMLSSGGVSVTPAGNTQLTLVTLNRVRVRGLANYSVGVMQSLRLVYAPEPSALLLFAAAGGRLANAAQAAHARTVTANADARSDRVRAGVRQRALWQLRVLWLVRHRRAAQRSC